MLIGKTESQHQNKPKFPKTSCFSSKDSQEEKRRKLLQFLSICVIEVDLVCNLNEITANLLIILIFHIVPYKFPFLYKTSQPLM